MATGAQWLQVRTGAAAPEEARKQVADAERGDLLVAVELPRDLGLHTEAGVLSNPRRWALFVQGAHLPARFCFCEP